jgi:hypothetical protein
MNIIGDNNLDFSSFVKKPGILWGHDHILEGKQCIKKVFVHFRDVEEIYFPKLYLHIPDNKWSSFTGKLREYCLPWRWKAVYLDREEVPQRVLMCTSVKDGKLTESLKKIAGKSLFVAKLIQKKCYAEFSGVEYIFFVEYMEEKLSFNRLEEKACHIYRDRGVFSKIGYFTRKWFSFNWKEVVITVDTISEKVLIQNDEKGNSPLEKIKSRFEKLSESSTEKKKIAISEVPSRRLKQQK